MKTTLVDRNTAVLTCASVGRQFSNYFVLLMTNRESGDTIDYCYDVMQIWYDTAKSLIIKRPEGVEDSCLEPNEWIRWFFWSLQNSSADAVGETLAKSYDKLMLILLYEDVSVRDAMSKVMQQN